MKHMKKFVLVALLLLALIFPWLFSDPTIATIAVFTLFYATATVSWNIFSGYTGYASLGYSAFTGLGAYTFATMCYHWNLPGGYLLFLLLPVAGLVSALVSLPIGWIILRTDRHAFVVVTIAVLFVFLTLGANLTDLTRGSLGIILPSPDWDISYYHVPFYYVSLFLLLLAFSISWWIRNSKYGLGLLAIRDDEERALGLGVRTGAFKLSAFVISAFLGGMAGGMYAYYMSGVVPESVFDISISVSMALMSSLGGSGTLYGPLLGAFLLGPLRSYLAILFGTSGWNLIILGSMLLVVILLLPEGILPSLRKWRSRRRVTQTVAVTSADEVVVSADTILVESSGREKR